MPTFRRLSREEIAARRPRLQTAVDLTDYLAFLEDLTPGMGGELALQEGESQRAVKRRMTMAGNRLGKKVRWRHSQEGTVRFDIS